MKPYLHGRIHAKKYGGTPEDYADIDDFIDSSKAAFADVRHRAILHSAFGCFIVEKVFGRTRVNSDDKIWAAESLGYVMGNDREWLADTKAAIKASGGVDTESCDQFAKMITCSEMTDVMLAMFGNHVRIVATRDGFDIEEFDHD